MCKWDIYVVIIIDGRKSAQSGYHLTRKEKEGDQVRDVFSERCGLAWMTVARNRESCKKLEEAYAAEATAILV